MILHHVPDGTGLLIVAASSLQANVLCHSNLYMIDVAAVPYWLENTIGEAEHKNVLHCFLTQIMIDTIDLFFPKDLCHLTVELTRRGKIVSKGLFDNDTRPAL